MTLSLPRSPLLLQPSPMPPSPSPDKAHQTPPPPASLFPIARSPGVEALIRSPVPYLQANTSKRGTFTHVTYSTVADATTALATIRTRQPQASFSTPQPKPLPSTLVFPSPSTSTNPTPSPAPAPSLALQFPALPAAAPTTTPSASSTDTSTATAATTPPELKAAAPTPAPTALPAIPEVAESVTPEPKPTSTSSPIDPSAASALLRLLRLAVASPAPAGSEEELLLSLIASATSPLPPSAPASAQLDSSVHDDESSYSPSEDYESETERPGSPGAHTLVLTNLNIEPMDNALEYHSSPPWLSFLIPSSSVVELRSSLPSSSTATFLAFPNCGPYNAVSTQHALLLEGFEPATPRQATASIHRLLALVDALPPPFAPHPTSPAPSFLGNGPNEVLSSDGLGFPRALLLGIARLNCQEGDSLLTITLTSLSALSGNPSPLLPLDVTASPDSFLEQLQQSASATPFATIRAAAAQYVRLNADMPFLTSPFSWTSLVTLHEWLPLVPLDAQDSTCSYSNIHDFVGELLATAPLTVPALAAIAFALSVNISLDLPSPNRALTLAGCCQFLTVDSTLTIDVLPRAATIRLSLTDTALSLIPPTV